MIILTAPKEYGDPKETEVNGAILKTELHTWFERDRKHVDLRNTDTDQTIVEWWDEAVDEAFEDGFLKSEDLHGSALKYAQSVGLI